MRVEEVAGYGMRGGDGMRWWERVASSLCLGMNRMRCWWGWWTTGNDKVEEASGLHFVRFGVVRAFWG